MSVTLQKHQENAKDSLVKYLGEPVDEGSRCIIVFKSPTASGKTVVMAEVMYEVSKGRDSKGKKVCYVWLCIGKAKLPEQSYESVCNQVGDYIDCVYLKDIIPARCVLEPGGAAFGSWESLVSEETNKLRKQGDYNNLEDFISNIKEEGIEIILIIDECHDSAATEKAKKVIDIIAPTYIVECSATPCLTGECDHIVRVKEDAVKKSGLIKKRIVINKGVKTHTEKDEITGIDVILDAAEDLYLELIEALCEEDSKVNPLILVQVPNGKRGGDLIKEVILRYKDRGITYDDGTLAILTNKYKENIEDIKKKDNKVRVLIFKQAVATGWDCPRAYILIKFRKTGKPVFDIQVVGRISRMAEGFFYKNPILNRAYVFTTNEKIIIKEDDNSPGFITDLSATLQIDKVPTLPSYYKKRIHYNAVNAKRFELVVTNVFKEEFGLSENYKEGSSEFEKVKNYGFNISNEPIKSDMMGEKEVDIYTKGTCAADEIHPVNASEHEVNDSVNEKIVNNLQEFTTKRSITPTKIAIYRFFYPFLPKEYSECKESYIWRVLLSDGVKFEYLLQKALAEYRESMPKNNYEESEFVWSPAKEVDYSSIIYERVEHRKYLYSNCCLKIGRSKAEKKFERYIDSRESVEWWLKNGDSGEEHFAIKYIDEKGKARSFYPDYIVLLKNGNVVILEIKSGWTAEVAKAKAEALIKYTQDHFDKTGGIAVEHGDSWLVHRSNKYYYDGTNFPGWDSIEDVLFKDKVLHIV